MRNRIKRLAADEHGGVLVETTVMLVLAITFVLGSVDFLFALYQWNAATKAVQVGARIAAVSNPVDSTFRAITGMEGGLDPGDPTPAATYATRTCTGASGGSCTGGTYDAAAMTIIVSGRCATATAYCLGMNKVFPRVQAQNVVISYASTGLGYAGRPGGPVPTISVSIANLPFQFYFLNFANIPIPGLTTTVTGEDLCLSTSSCPGTW
jgi:TadE-like protein